MMDEAIAKIARDLESYRIPYVFPVWGRENRYGYSRTTLVPTVILAPEKLRKFSDALVGGGYEFVAPGAAKAFRWTEGHVPIEVITTDEYPGDGLPKVVRFPDPATEYAVINGVRTVPLPRLVEVKLASGMTGRGRLKDLADVQELIKILKLPADFSEQLDPSVRAKFAELYADLHDG